MNRKIYMNIKIVVDESTTGTVRATIYSTETSSNIGTLWMTRDEFDNFVNCLTFGIPEGGQLEIDDTALSDNDY